MELKANWSKTFLHSGFQFIFTGIHPIHTSSRAIYYKIKIVLTFLQESRVTNNIKNKVAVTFAKIYFAKKNSNTKIYNIQMNRNTPFLNTFLWQLMLKWLECTIDCMLHRIILLKYYLNYNDMLYNCHIKCWMQSLWLIFSLSCNTNSIYSVSMPLQSLIQQMGK